MQYLKQWKNEFVMSADFAGRVFFSQRIQKINFTVHIIEILKEKKNRRGDLSGLEIH